MGTKSGWPNTAGSDQLVYDHRQQLGTNHDL